MPSNCSHLQVHAHWNQMIRKVKKAEHVENAVRDVIVETAKLCETATRDEMFGGDPKRLHFLFIDKKHGLAGWTKEAL